MKRPLLWICPLVLAATSQVWAGPGADEISKLLPGKSGLVVTVDCEDSQVFTDLAATGRVLVHMLVDDRQSRDAFRKSIRDTGLYGAVSVETVFDHKRLPYCDGLVNVLIVDRASGAGREMTIDEILRVLAPGGKAMVREGASWKTIGKPVNSALGQWTHQNGNAANNPVSDDRTLAPVSTVRWIDGFARAGDTMGGRGGIPVIGNGVIVQDDPRGYISQEGGRPNRAQRLICRDAHSGVVRWALPVRSNRLWLAIDGGILVSAYPLDMQDPAIAVHVQDLATGEVLRSLKTDLERVDTSSVHGVCRGGMAYLAVAESAGHDAMKSGRLVAYDLSSGEVRWQVKADGFDSFFSPSLTPDGQRLIVVQAKGRRTGINARWPWAYIDSIACRDPATGQTMWQNRELSGQVTLHMPVTDRYAFFASPWGIGSHYEHIPREQRDALPRSHGVIELGKGQVLWRKGIADDDGATDRHWSQVALFRGDEAFLCSPVYFMAWDAASGRLTRRVNTNVFNQRCVRSRACEKYLILGFGTFYDFERQLQTDQNVARSACAVGPTPAYGTIYNGANGCGCFAQVRGYGAFAASAPVPVLPDSARLDTGPWPAGPEGEIAVVTEVDRITTEDRRLKQNVTWRAVVDTDRPLLDSWVNNEDAPFPSTRPVRANDLELVAIVCEHRLEARQESHVVWSLTADARIGSPPLVHEGRVYVASHDGRVYCCELASGRLLWRAMIAPNVRRMVAYGQIESAWPVRNVVLYDGFICAAAGRHPELDGGIHVAGLDPATGQAKWRETIAYDSARQWFSPDDRQRQRHLNWITNGGLAVDGGRLLLIGLDKMHGGGNKVPRLEPLPLRPKDASLP